MIDEGRSQLGQCNCVERGWLLTLAFVAVAIAAWLTAPTAQIESIAFAAEVDAIGAPAPVGFADIIERVKPAVVGIRVRIEGVTIPDETQNEAPQTAQRRFDRAMRYQHSFWYKASKEIFEDALKADPECGIAYWGIALGLVDNPHFGPPAPNLPLGLAAIQAAKATGAKTQRERDYIDALALLYVDYDKTTRAARIQSYLKAMEELAARYPDDDEAQIFVIEADDFNARHAASPSSTSAAVDPLRIRTSLVLC